VACYRLQALSASGAALRTSDILCVLARMAFGAGPTAISVVFTQPNIAQVAWGDAPGTTSYVFLALGTPRSQIVPAATHSISDDTRGAVTCYGVASRSGVSMIGFSDFVCGLSL